MEDSIEQSYLVESAGLSSRRKDVVLVLEAAEISDLGTIAVPGSQITRTSSFWATGLSGFNDFPWRGTLELCVQCFLNVIEQDTSCKFCLSQVPISNLSFVNMSNGNNILDIWFIMI